MQVRAKPNSNLRPGSAHPALNQSTQGSEQLSKYAALRKPKRRRPGGTPPAAQQPDSSRDAAPDWRAPSAAAGGTPPGGGCRRRAACGGRGALFAVKATGHPALLC